MVWPLPLLFDDDVRPVTLPFANVKPARITNPEMAGGRSDLSPFSCLLIVTVPKRGILIVFLCRV